MKIKASINADKVAESMITRSARVTQCLGAKLEILTIMLQGYIITDKMQGQVIQQRTANSVRSIRTIPVVVSGDQVTGGVEGGGGTAFYLRYLNDGTTPGQPWIIEAKNAQALAFIPGALYGPFKKSQMRLLGAKRTFSPTKPGAERNAFNSSGGILVKRVLHPPQRPLKFMEEALYDKHQEIIEGLIESIQEGAS